MKQTTWFLIGAVVLVIILILVLVYTSNIEPNSTKGWVEQGKNIWHIAGWD